MRLFREPLVRRWLGSRNGNVSVIFALSAVPIVLMMGAAVDYTRAITKRTSLQQATDATVLSVAHDLTQNLPIATVTQDAQRYFAAAVDDSNAYIFSGPTVSTDNTQVCLTARTVVPTLIMSVASGAGLTARSSTTVAANSCAKINNTTYEIALALDNSGSMNESTSGTTKMASLQNAAEQLIGLMDPSGQTPKTSFSIVPFSSAVNVGSGYANAAWMDTGGKSSIHFQNFQMLASSYRLWVPTSKFDFFRYTGASWAGCVEERPAPYMTTDTAADSTVPDTLFVPYFWPDEASSGLNNYLASSTTGYCSSQPSPYTGAVSNYVKADSANNSIAVTNSVMNTLRGDSQTEVCKYRGQSVSNTYSSFTDINGNRLKAGPNLLCSSQPLTTLTNDTTVLNTAVDAMTSNGDTSLIGGFMWAWRTISPNGPFGTQATVTTGNQNPKTYATNGNVKVIILMTDGYNHWANMTGGNLSAYSSLGYFPNARLGTTTSSNYRTLMDNATLAACTNAKAAGVQIFTVGFSIPSNPIDTAGLNLLQSCATQASMAYIAQDGSGLITTFKQIANALSGLRLVN